ncbi:small ribosomal subunit Rsm22 family protein [Desulfonatronum thioautotrophicum]|uniref:small ribosomal subunit Rsm22 family protein n=1 Tax=Desulfonatronum thioautotrophicum TaxID=617001 RepID=UPI0012946A9D|nr:small ribosomal subunit Rsm22 family protein [Desulfonatronum thioautotrophicum]
MSDAPQRATVCSRSPFPDLTGASERALAGYADLLRAVLPMKAAHRRKLPDNIQELSTFLVEDRAEVLGRDYLHAPAALGAYLWYFLPWNLLRMTRLLGGLNLDPPEGGTVVDLGAGPLTLVQALALARPDLLARELHFHCLDTTPRPMREGRKLFHGLVDILKDTLDAGHSRWKIHLVHAPWQVGIKSVPQADLLTAGNFLNELPWNRRDPLSEQVAGFFQTVAGHVRPDGQCLFVEPGNRFGGKLVSLVREEAVAGGWKILGPCTHHHACPMLEHRETSWCHFTLSVRGCPPWLRELSREADLPKRDISLSYVHLAGPGSPDRFLDRKAEQSPERNAPAKQMREEPLPEGWARIVSGEFSVPDRMRESRETMVGRYGCAAQGKLLILSPSGQSATRSGDCVRFRLADPLRRDSKTRALVAELLPAMDGPKKKAASPTMRPGQSGQSATNSPPARGHRDDRKPGTNPKATSTGHNRRPKRSQS